MNINVRGKNWIYMVISLKVFSLALNQIAMLTIWHDVIPSSLCNSLCSIIMAGGWVVIFTFYRSHITVNRTLWRFYSLDNKNTLNMGLCNKCPQKNDKNLNFANFKPDKSHHCSVCKRCVLKMDHHCFYIQNCVGLHNYRYFFQLLMYGNVVFLCLIYLYLNLAYTILQKL